MSFANSSATQLGFISEATWGTTPATPAFNLLRYTGESFNIDTETAVSQEIRPDRNIPDLIRVGSGASGGFEFEMSYGTLDDLLASLLFSSWTTDVVENGVTPSSFSFERKLETGATDAYHRFTGMYPSEMSLNIEAGAIVTGSMGFMGKGGSVATTAITGATYNPANTKQLMNAVSDFAGLTMTGITGTPQIMNLGLNLSNNLRGQKAIGSLDNVGIGYGRFEATGSIRAYFENNSLLSAYLAGTSFNLQFTLGNTTGEKYTILLPKVKIEAANAPSPGNDQDVMTDLTFRGLYDSTEGSTIKITRAVA